MTAGSRYLQCDSCPTVLDRRPAGDWKEGGAFKSWPELIEYATEQGWQWSGSDPVDRRTKHYCAQCALTQS